MEASRLVALLPLSAVFCGNADLAWRISVCAVQYERSQWFGGGYQPVAGYVVGAGDYSRIRASCERTLGQKRGLPSLQNAHQPLADYAAQGVRRTFYVLSIC